MDKSLNNESSGLSAKLWEIGMAGVTSLPDMGGLDAPVSVLSAKVASGMGLPSKSSDGRFAITHYSNGGCTLGAIRK